MRNLGSIPDAVARRCRHLNAISHFGTKQSARCGPAWRKICK